MYSIRSLTLSQRFKNGSDVHEFTSLDDSASKRVLNLLELIQLRVRKIVAQRVTVVTFGENNGGSDDTDGFRVQVRTDATKFANVRITGFRQCSAEIW